MTASYTEALGGHYAAGQAVREFAGASSLLFMLADAIRNTPADQAESAAAQWAQAIDYVARSLGHNETFVADWVRPRTVTAV